MPTIFNGLGFSAEKVFVDSICAMAKLSGPPKVSGLRREIADKFLTPAERRASVTWAHRLKRVFSIDMQACSAYGGAVRFIACIGDAEIFEKILTHLDTKTDEPEALRHPPCWHAGLMPFAGQRDARAQVPMDAIG